MSIFPVLVFWLICVCGFFGYIAKNLTDLAIEDSAEVIEGGSAYGLVVAQPVDGGAADAVNIYQEISALIFFF